MQRGFEEVTLSVENAINKLNFISFKNTQKI